ncbi:MAG: DUF1854 domain-containing protein [Verrucomicrobiota bacterium]
MNTTENPLTFDDKVIDAALLKARRRSGGGLDIELPGQILSDIHLTPAFPISGRKRMVMILNREGEELGFIDNISKLDAASRSVIEEELERSYFMPRIITIIDAEEKLSVLTLSTETDRGGRTIQVRNPRQSIRKLPYNRVVIKDVDGNRYEIRDWTRLQPYGREILVQYM